MAKPKTMEQIIKGSPAHAAAFRIESLRDEKEDAAHAAAFHLGLVHTTHGPSAERATEDMRSKCPYCKFIQDYMADKSTDIKIN